MSGWDEGAVFYSDQAQFPGGPGADPAADLTRHSALRKFKEFLRGFTSPTGDFPYRESLMHNRDHVIVAIEDLDAFDAELSDKIRKAPPDYLPLFETAGSEVLASLRSKVAGETGEMEEPVTGDVQIFLSSKESCLSMRSVGADYMSKLVKTDTLFRPLYIDALLFVWNYQDLGFKEYIEEVYAAYEQHKLDTLDSPKASKFTGVEMTEEEAVAEQQRMFAEARARMNNGAPKPKESELEPHKQPQQPLQSQLQLHPEAQQHSQPQLQLHPQAQQPPQPQLQLHPQAQQPPQPQLQLHPQAQLPLQPQVQLHPQAQPQQTLQPQLQLQPQPQQPAPLMLQPQPPQVQLHPQAQPQQTLQPQLQLHPQSQQPAPLMLQPQPPQVQLHPQAQPHQTRQPQLQLHPQPQQPAPLMLQPPQSQLEVHPQLTQMLLQPQQQQPEAQQPPQPLPQPQMEHGFDS